MHELGIVTHVAKTVDNICEANHVTRVGSVTLEIGEVSGVVNDLMTDCWNYFRKKHPLLEEAELIIEIIPAVTFCEDCHETYPTVRYGKICPYCSSENTYLVQGNECMIKQIEAETEDE